VLKLGFREEIMSRTETFHRFSNFKSGLASVNYTEHYGCPSTSRTDENEHMNELFHCIAIYDLATEVGIPFGLC
jgi:hypothetical protein